MLPTLTDQILALLAIKTKRPSNQIGPGRRTCLSLSGPAGCETSHNGGPHQHLAEKGRKRQHFQALRATRGSAAAPLPTSPSRQYRRWLERRAYQP